MFLKRNNQNIIIINIIIVGGKNKNENELKEIQKVLKETKDVFVMLPNNLVLMIK